MIEVVSEADGGLITVRMSGTVTETDQEQQFSKVQQRPDSERVERVLLDWSELDGWGPGARSAGTWFGMHHWALVGRIAILADDKWSDEVLRITDVYRAATVRRFPPSDRRAAIDWLVE
ncbi:MAG: STAS/SEC14 domain-containing protein [Rhodospirillales bacterium]|nr:STAS/SEC14 domain-containing protein [Rhodospirillales bacterium]